MERQSTEQNTTTIEQALALLNTMQEMIVDGLMSEEVA